MLSIIRVIRHWWRPHTAKTKDKILRHNVYAFNLLPRSAINRLMCFLLLILTFVIWGGRLSWLNQFLYRSPFLLIVTQHSATSCENWKHVPCHSVCYIHHCIRNSIRVGLSSCPRAKWTPQRNKQHPSQPHIIIAEKSTPLIFQKKGKI